MVVGGGKGYAVCYSKRYASMTALLPMLLAGVQPPPRPQQQPGQAPAQAPPVETVPQAPVAEAGTANDQQTAASLAATHNQFAAVSTPPAEGSVQPAPGGGTPAAGGPPAAYPPPATPPAAPQQQPQPAPAAPRPQPAAAQPTSSVDSLLAQAGKPKAGGAPEKGKKVRKGQKKEVDPLELQKKVIRLSFTVILVIIIVGYAGRTLNREFGTSEIWNNGVVDIMGVFALGAALFLWMRAVSVGGLIRERVSPSEQSRLAYIRMGGILLWMVPIVGSFGYYAGIVFQSSDMHWIFYVITGLGALALLYGLAGSKERGSFYQIFMFGVFGIVLATIPMAFAFFGEILASSFWWTASFIAISIGFILMAIMVRQMRADQYTQLDKVLERADKAFANRRFDEAQKFYSEAITLTHTLYADVVFSGRNPRERGGTSIPQEYFRPWIGKAKCLALTGKLRKALAIYDLMLEVDPDNSIVWFDRGRILVAEKRYAEAYISFDRAVKLDPNLEYAKEKRAEVLDVIRKTSM